MNISRTAWRAATMIILSCASTVSTSADAQFLRRWRQARVAGQAPPPAPDYGRDDAWAARPDTPDDADLTPPGMTDRQRTARADVFFIHPTTYFGRTANAPATKEQGGFGGVSVDATIREQATAFNDCCRVFAPRYRQASIAAFSKPDQPQSIKALELAYNDVLRAFDYYIAHENRGRPFIIAGHSQGALHAMRLLQQRIAGTPLARQLVAAYVIGSLAPRDVAAPAFPDCASPTQAHCVVNWNSVTTASADRTRGGSALIWNRGRYVPVGNRPLLCVNPLDWRIDGSAPAATNLGSLPTGRGGDGLPALLPAGAGARCVNGLLVVDLPAGSPFHPSKLIGEGSLHIVDYNLFWANLRANATARVAAF